MATTTHSDKFVDFDEYVGLKIEKTRETIRMTDMLTALAGVAAIFLGYLLTFVFFDQWIFRDGFGLISRWILLSFLVIFTVAWLAWKVGIPSFRRVNQLFAAREIEKSDPTLKSNLLNLIDLKEAGRPINPSILQAMERQAAIRLQQVDIGQAIDHRPLLRTAWTLLTIIILFCAYALLSPKKISNSIWRGLLPAAEVSISTRTEILNVQPGNITVPAHTPSVEVQVDLSGEIPPKVMLLYTTADHRFNREPIELRVEAEGQTRYNGQILSENSHGLMQDVTYVISAGDAESATYKITVEQPPSAEIETVRIEFPQYMKLETIEQVNNGQIDAWEGAKVTITAKTNMPVKSASIQFLDDPQKGPTGEEISVTVNPGGRVLHAHWTLALRNDGTFPKYYRFDCRTEDGRRDTAPTNYGLTIRPDLPPEIVMLQPDQDLEAPANTTIPLLIQARDPDFELGYIYLNADKAGQRVLRDQLSEGRQSKLILKHNLHLSKLNAVAGDEFEVWVEAYDNKQPRPNSKNAPKIKIKVVGPVSMKEAEQKLADQSERREQKLAEAEQETNADRNNPGEQRDGEGNRQRTDDQRSNDQRIAENQQKNGNEQQDPANGQDGQQGANQTAAHKSGKQATDPQNAKGSGQGQKSARSKEDADSSSNNESGSGGERNSKPVNSDGSQDDEAIRRLNEILRKNAESKQTLRDQSEESNPPQSNQDGSTSSNDHPPSNDDGKSDTEHGDGKSEKSKQPPNRIGDQSEPQKNQKDAASKKNDSTANGDKSEEQDETNKSAARTEPKSTPPKPDPESAKATKDRANSDKPNASTDPSHTDEKPTPKDSQGKEPGKQSVEPKSESAESKPEKAKSEKAEEGTKPEGATADDLKNDDPNQKQEKSVGTTKPESDPKMNEQKSEQQSGAKSGNEKQKQNQTKSESSQEQAEGSKPTTQNLPEGMNKNSPTKKDGASGEKSKDEAGRGNDSNQPGTQKEQTTDSPNAKKEDADGTEQGTAKPDRDPKSDPKQQKADGVTRDPNEKPETRPGQEKREEKPADGAKPKNDTASKREQKAKSKTPVDQPSPTGQADESTDKSQEMQDKGRDDSQGSKSGKASDKSQDGPDGKDSDSQETSSNDDSGKQNSKSGKSNAKGGEPSKSTSDSDSSSKAKSSNGKDGQSASKESSDQKSDDGSEGGEASSKDKSEDKDAMDKAEKPAEGGGEKSDQQSSDDGQGGDKQKSGEGKSDKGGKSDQGKSGGDKGQGKDGKGKGSGKSSTAGKSGKANSNDTSGNSTGGERDGEVSNSGGSSQLAPGDDANLEYNRQATELILQKLKKELERGDVDPQLLEQLGWTPDQMKQFADRLSKHLDESKRPEETPESKARQQQFQEMLKNLDLQKSGTQRSGEKEPKREVQQFDSKRTPIPAQYRSPYEKFTKDMAKQGRRP